MSKSIDQKIVEMQFDNKNFEKNVSTSMGTLDKLKKKLDFTDEGKSFQELEKKAEKTDFKDFKNNIDKVSVKFDAMQVAAITALTNITNKAIDTGIQLVKSLSTDQIAAGWEKFGEMTINTGTLVSQGFDIDEINEQLDKLLWFTDETSYNFTDMVNNISKFTGAGQGLTESVDAMQGIALWAAMSGQNASTASRAMYQLSQAMGSGVIKLQDWQSILTANMATQEFKQKALDAAVKRGTLQKLEDGYYISLIEDLEHEAEEFNINQFSTQLTSGLWFTSDVLMDVLGEYSAAVQDIYDKAEETGMTASEVMEEFGDTLDEFGLKAFAAGQEARTFEDVINSIKDAVSTGYMNIFTDIFGSYDEAKVFWTDLANAAWEVFAGPVDETHQKLSAALGTEMRDLKELKDWSDIYMDSHTDVSKDLATALSDFDHYTAQLLGQKLTYEVEGFTATEEKLDFIAEKSGIAKESLRGLLDLINKEGGLDSQVVQDKISSLVSGSEKDIKYLNTVMSRAVGTIEKTRTGTNVESILEFAKQYGKDSEEFENLLNEWVTDDDELKQVIRDFISVQDSGYTSDTMIFWTLAESIGTTTENIEALYALVNENGLDDSSVKDFIETLTNGDEELGLFTEHYLEATTEIATATTGRQNLVEAFWALWDGIASIAERVKTAFRNVFPESQWSSVYALTVKIKDAIKAMMPKEETLQKIQDFFEGVFTVFKEIGEVLKAIFQPFGDMIKSLFSKPEGEGGGLLDKLAEWGKSVSDGFEDFKNGKLVSFISDTSQWIVDKLSWLLNKGKELVTKIKDSVVKFFTDPIIKTGDLNDDGTEETISRLDWIMEKFDAFKNWATDIWEKFKALLSKIKEGIKNSGVDKALEGFWENIKKVFSDIVDGIKNLFGKKEEIDTGKAGELDSGPITEAADKVGNFFTDISDKFSKLWEKIKPARDALKNVWNGIKLAFSYIWDNILVPFFNWVANIDFSKLFADAGLLAGGGAALGLTAIEGYKTYWIISAIKEITEMMDELAQGFAGFGYFAEDFGESLKLKSISKLIKAVGAMLVELAAAFVAVAMMIKKVDDPEAIAEAGVVIGTMLTAVSSVLVYLTQSGNYVNGGKSSKFETGSFLQEFKEGSGASKMKAIAAEMVAIGAAVFLIAKAMEAIADIGDWKKIAAVGGVVVLILDTIGGILVALNATDNGKGSLSEGIGRAVELIAICVVLKRVTKVIKELAAMSVGELAKGILGLAAVLVIVGGIVVGISALPMDKDKIRAFGFAMLELAAAMWVFGKYMKEISSLNWEDIGKAVSVFVVVAGALAGVMFIPFDGKKAVAFAGAMDLMSVAMLLLLPVIKAFAEMNTDECNQALMAVGIISAIMVALGALLAVGGTFGGAGALMMGTALFLTATAILELAAALALFADIAPQLEERAPMIADALITIGSALAAAIPTVLGDVAAAIAEAAPKVGDMIIALLKLALDIVVESALTIAQTVVTLVLKILDVVAENIGPIIDKLITIFLAVINEAASRASEIVVALVNLFKAIFAGLSEAFGDDFDLEKVLEGVAILSALLVAMTAITIMAAEALATVALLNAIADQLNIFIVKIMPFVVACRTIDPASMEGALLLAEVILTLTAASILEGLTSWFTGGVDYAKFAEGLNEMAPAIKSFADQMADVDGENLKNAAQGALYLTEFANNLPHEGGLLQLLTGQAQSMTDFAKGLEDLAPSLISFAQKAKELKEEEVKAIEVSVKAVKALAKMADALPRHGGLWQKIIGEVTSMKDFGEDLIALIPNLLDYAEQAKLLDGSKVEAINVSIPAVIALAQMADALPRHGGLWQLIIGEVSSMKTFGEDLTDFAPKLIAYGQAVLALKEPHINAILRSAQAASALVAVSNSIAPQGNPVFAWLVGNDTKFTDFSDNIGYIADGLVSYSSKLVGANIDDAVKSVDLATALVSISNAIAPNGNPVINWFLGKQSLDQFGNNLEAFGGSLKRYCDAVAGIDDASVAASDKATSSLVGVMTSLKTANGEFNAWAIKDFGFALEAFGGSYKTFVTNTKDATSGVDVQALVDGIVAVYTNLGSIPLKTIITINEITKIDSGKVKTFGQDLKDFGADVKTYVDTVGSYITSNIQKAVDNVKDLIEGLSDISKSDVENINSLTGSLTRLAEDGVQRFISEFTNKQTDAKNAGGNFIQSFIDGANSKEESLKLAAGNLSDDMITKFKSLVTDYEEVGQSMVLSIANGINNSKDAEDNLKPIADYATNLKNKFDTAFKEIDFKTVGAGAIDTFKSAIAESGTYVSASFASTEEGLAQGVKDIKVYYTSFYDAGYYLVDGFKLGIEERSKAVEESASNLGGKAFAALKNALKEASPSKLTYQVGEFFTQGFADGIVGDIDYVERSINYISDRTYEEMQNVINNIGDKLDDDIEDNLTITPVLDLTEFEAGTRIMNRYLGDMATSRVGAMAAADSMATRVTSQSIQNQMLEKLNETETPLGGESNNYNSFYIQSNDPHEVATEVSRILQKQVERRNSVWE